MIQSKILIHHDFYHAFRIEGENLPFGLTGPGGREIFPGQVHGKNILEADKFTPLVNPGYDGLVTNEKKIMINIKTADCLPILFIEADKKIAGIVHAGWKGLSLNIIEKAVNKIVRLGGDKEHLLVAIGPHIRSCCYEVNAERISHFSGYGSVTLATGRGTYMLDLEKIALQQLLRQEVPLENIDVIRACTACDQTWPSYRREGERANRIISSLMIIH